jgi:hypothetical protein
VINTETFLFGFIRFWWTGFYRPYSISDFPVSVTDRIKTYMSENGDMIFPTVMLIKWQSLYCFFTSNANKLWQLVVLHPYNVSLLSGNFYHLPDRYWQLHCFRSMVMVTWERRVPYHHLSYHLPFKDNYEEHIGNGLAVAHKINFFNPDTCLDYRCFC